MAIEVETKANLLMVVLKQVNVGELIRCEGINNSELCCDAITRNIYDCKGCGAIDLVNDYIPVKLVNKGTIQKKTTS